MNYSRQKIIFYSYIIIMLLIPMMYWNTLLGKTWVYITVGCICMLVVIFQNILSKIWASKYYKLFSLFVILSFFEILLLNMIQPDSFSFEDSICILYVLLFMVMGSNLFLSEKRVKIISLVYSIAFLLIAISTITFSGGFVISEIYAVSEKNAYGPILVTIHVMSFFEILHKKNNFLFKLLYVSIFILSIICLLILRARTAMVAMIIVDTFIFYYFYKNHKNIVLKIFLIGLFVLPLAVFLEKSIIPPTVKTTVINSFFANKNIKDFDDVTSGRMTLVDQSLTNIEKNPLFGRIFDNNQEKSKTHNYIIRIITDYGYIGSLPWLGCFFLLLLNVIRSIVNIKKPLKSGMLGVFLMIIPFIISLGEPLAPFGPGTVFFFNYLMFGLYLNSCTVVNNYVSYNKNTTQCTKI